MPAIKVENNEHWHQLRKEHVGASESAALFGESPYVTGFGLWHEKKGTYQEDRDSNFTRWGNRLESVIAKGIAEDNEWKIQKVHQYHIHPKIKGMGASLDYRFIDDPRGPGVYEIKNVDSMVFREKFVVEGKQIIEAPLYFELQLQHQMAVTGYEWGRLGALVGGNNDYYLERERHQPTIEALEIAVIKFWETIEKGIEPEVSSYQDLAYAQKVFNGTRTLVIENERLNHYGYVLKDLQKQALELDKAIDVAKAQILREMNALDACDVKVGEYHFKNIVQKRKETIIPAWEKPVFRLSTSKSKKEASDG